MVQVKDVRWGSYSSREGPYYYGKCKYELPERYDFLDEVFYVTSAAEGALESVNMYDSCRMTCGALQWCDAAPQLSTTDMLGMVAERHSDPSFLFDALSPALKASGATFKKNSRDKWRFFLLDGREVNSTHRQEELYFKGATGLKGSWNDEQREHAKLWAACVASVFEDKEAGRIQCEFTKPKLMSFVRPGARSILFVHDGDNETAWMKLVQNAYITFAVNNPTWASQALHHAVGTSKHDKWTGPWVIDVLRELTYFKGIGIYPKRYEHIARKLEKLYGLRLPRYAAELKTAERFIRPSDGTFVCLADVQEALKHLGHDPGKVDGLFGGNTRDAVRSFQEHEGTDASGVLSESIIKRIAEVLKSVGNDATDAVSSLDRRSRPENDPRGSRGDEMMATSSTDESPSEGEYGTRAETPGIVHGDEAPVDHDGEPQTALTKTSDESQSGFMRVWSALRAFIELLIRIFKKK